MINEGYKGYKGFRNIVRALSLGSSIIVSCGVAQAIEIPTDKTHEEGIYLLHEAALKEPFETAAQYVRIKRPDGSVFDVGWISKEGEERKVIISPDVVALKVNQLLTEKHIELSDLDALQMEFMHTHPFIAARAETKRKRLKSEALPPSPGIDVNHRDFIKLQTELAKQVGISPKKVQIVGKVIGPSGVWTYKSDTDSDFYLAEKLWYLHVESQQDIFKRLFSSTFKWMGLKDLVAMSTKLLGSTVKFKQDQDVDKFNKLISQLELTQYQTMEQQEIERIKKEISGFLSALLITTLYTPQSMDILMKNLFTLKTEKSLSKNIVQDIDELYLRLKTLKDLLAAKNHIDQHVNKIISGLYIMWSIARLESQNKSIEDIARMAKTPDTSMSTMMNSYGAIGFQMTFEPWSSSSTGPVADD